MILKIKKYSLTFLDFPLMIKKHNYSSTVGFIKHTFTYKENTVGHFSNITNF